MNFKFLSNPEGVAFDDVVGDADVVFEEVDNQLVLTLVRQSGKCPRCVMPIEPFSASQVILPGDFLALAIQLLYRQLQLHKEPTNAD